MFTEQYIRFEATNANVFHRGKNYFQAGCVFEIDYNPLANCFHAMVEGTYDYKVTVDLKQDYSVSDYSCNCEAFQSYGGACKHVVATLFEILSRKKEWTVQQPMSDLNDATKAFFDFAEKESIEDFLKEPVYLVPTLCVGESYGSKRVWLELSLGDGRQYLVKNIKTLVESYIREEPLVLGKQFTYEPTRHEMDATGKAIMKLLINQYYDEFELVKLPMTPQGSKLSLSAFSNAKQFRLNNSQLHTLMQAIQGNAIDIYIKEILHPNVGLKKALPPVGMNIESDSTKGITTVMLNKGFQAYMILDWQGKYIYHNHMIYEVDDLFAGYFQKLLPCFERGHIEVPDHLLDRFANEVYPSLKQNISSLDGEALEMRFEQKPLEASVFFDRFENGITAKVLFKYGEIVFNPCKTAAYPPFSGEKRLFRNRLKEKQIISHLKGFGFLESTEHFVLHEDESLFYFLEDGVDWLKNECELFYSDGFKQFKIRETFDVSSEFRMNYQTNLLEVTFDYDLEDVKELMAVLEAYKNKRKYMRLKDGSVLKLQSESLEMLSEIAAYNEDLLKGDSKALNPYEGFYVSRLLERYPAHGNVDYQERFKGILRPNFTDEVIAKGHKSVLRDYQKRGVIWLKTLTHYGFGGILADDMGLGKTLQVLSYLLGEKESGYLKLPALVVAPTSLIYNWQDEIKKFAGDLSIMLVAGSKSERMACFETMKSYDVVITTYGMLKRDVEYYKSQSFSYCFIDEAQHIKNPLTLNAKAVKSVQAGTFFALTGTPIENTLTELWSIFDFIMPGYLGTVRQFQKMYMASKEGATPTVQTISRLKHQIEPFILRRLKKEVLTELPDKIESKMTCEMTKEQKILYRAQLLRAKEEIEDEIKSNGLNQSRVKILAVLTRLRQICCHPSLFLEDYNGGSGKLDQLLELVEDAIASGHRLLIFSQFTSMLGIIQKAFEKMGVGYFYLDGSTPAENRTEMCRSFNEGENDVFLISLKAGGTGLNLTGADMVVHVDPWWNPAVEDQATDRAYRMGQKKSVQVFKMITRDTLEEKIFALQEKKKDLIDTVIVSGGEVINKMSEQEILSLFD